MSIRRVSVDLSVRDNFQSLPYLKANLDPTVDTKPQPILPKVVWSINTLASENGLRAATFVPEDVAPIPLVSNVNSPLFRVVEVIDTTGNLSYMLLDDTPGPVGDRRFYVLDSLKEWRLMATSPYNQNTLYFPIKHTLFQNRTLVFKSAETITGNTWTINNNVAGSAWVEFDLVNFSLTMYAIIGNEQWAGQSRGVASWGNYMIVYTGTRMYWSNPLNFADFVPAAGGAGSAKISEAQGPILFIVPNTTGLLIYCLGNIVYAEYSGDSANPWIFGEVKGSEGLLIYEGEPLVTKNEQSPFQVALTSNGLVVVSNQGVEPAPANLNNLIGLEYTEHREQGKIRRHYYQGTHLNKFKYNKVKRLDLFGTKLFIIIGELDSAEADEDYNRLMIYDLQTGDAAWVQGDIRSVVPTINLTQSMTSDRAQHRKTSPVVTSFVITKRKTFNGQPTNFNIIMDLGNSAITDILEDSVFTFKPAEFMIGGLQLRRGYSTQLHSVRLSGELSVYDEVAANGTNPRCRVFVYESYNGYSLDNEFLYTENGIYRGYAAGDDLRVLVIGPSFLINEIEFEIASGGRSA